MSGPLLKSSMLRLRLYLQMRTYTLVFFGVQAYIGHPTVDSPRSDRSGKVYLLDFPVLILNS